MYVINLPMETLMCQIQYVYVIGQKSCDPNSKPCQMPIKFGLQVKSQHCKWIINVHLLIVIGQSAKYNMTMSKQLVTNHTRRHVKNIINLTLKSNVNIVSKSRMYTTHSRIMKPMCQIWQANVEAKKLQARHDVKNPLNLTFRPKVNVISRS